MSRKRILFVYPTSYDEQGQPIYKRKAFFPSRTLPYLAALTPDRFEVSIVDEAVSGLDLEADADLVALTGMLRHVPRAIDLAREFRRRGKKTVFGGVAAFSIQDELIAKNAFDALVIGEAEDIWPVLLDDFEVGRLQPVYRCEHAPDLTDRPPARFDLLDASKYMKTVVDWRHHVVPIETGRGCPYDCSYCLVTRFFGKKLRFRPVGQVVDEIRACQGKYIVFTDDNIGIHADHARELFQAIKPLGIRWFGQFDCGIVKRPELLRLAGESGCLSGFVGVESLDTGNLQDMNKKHNLNVPIQELAKGFQEAGVALMASMIFGLDNDTKESIAATVEELIRNRVECLVPWLLMPTPATPLYDTCKNEGRLLHDDYSRYDINHVICRPKNMSVEDLEEAFWGALRRFYSLSSIFHRLVGKKEFLLGVIFNLYYRAQALRHVHPFSS